MTLSLSSISLLLYLAAAVLFFLAAVSPKGWYLPIGLCCFTLGHAIGGITFKAASPLRRRNPIALRGREC